MADTGDIVEQAIAVRIPDNLKSVDQARLGDHIATAELRYCVLTHREAEPDSPERWPKKG